MPLSDDLNRLESGGLIRLAGETLDPEYLFRHALVQEAAYASLVRIDRRALHLAVGEALERLYVDRAASRDLAPLLGRHFAGGGDDRRAVKYYTAAGDASAGVYANQEAVAHYAQAVEAAGRLEQRAAPGEPPIAGEDLIRLYLGLGTVLELNAQYDRALAVYDRLEALAEQRGERPMRLAGLMARAKIYSTGNPRYEPPQARAILEQALALIQQGAAESDRAAEAQVLWNLMLLNIFTAGDMRRAIEYGEQSIALARALHLRQQLAMTAHDIYYAYAYTGQQDRADATLAEAQSLWRELGNKAMLADNLSNVSIRAMCRGEFDRALAISDEAHALSESIDNAHGQATSRFMIGHVYLERGQPGTAVAIMEDTIRVGEQVGHPPALIATRSDLAWALASLGAVQAGEALARAAAAYAEATFPLWRSWAFATLSRILLLRGDLDRAEATAQQARLWLAPGSLQFMGYYLTPLAEGEVALACGRPDRALACAAEILAVELLIPARFLVPDALLLRSRACAALGQADLAQRACRQAVAEAEALGSRRSLWPALLRLADMEAGPGGSGRRAALRERARETVEYIAGQIGREDLRASFLALPQARKALDSAAG